MAWSPLEICVVTSWLTLSTSISTPHRLRMGRTQCGVTSTSVTCVQHSGSAWSYILKLTTWQAWLFSKFDVSRHVGQGRLASSPWVCTWWLFVFFFWLDHTARSALLTQMSVSEWVSWSLVPDYWFLIAFCPSFEVNPSEPLWHQYGACLHIWIVFSDVLSKSGILDRLLQTMKYIGQMLHLRFRDSSNTQTLTSQVQIYHIYIPHTAAVQPLTRFWPGLINNSYFGQHFCGGEVSF